MEGTMSGNIRIDGLDRATVLAALYNASRTQGAGIFEYTPNSMTIIEAQFILDSGETEFDYLRGRVMKVDLSKDVLDPRDYDRDNGPDATKMVIDRLRQGDEVKPEPASDEGNAVRLEARLGNATMFEDKTK